MIKKILFLLMATLAVVGCEKDHDHRRDVKVQLSEPNLPEGVTPPKTYNVAFDDKFLIVPSGSEVTLNALQPGEHTLYIYNSADSIAINMNEGGFTIRVDTQGGVVSSKPDMFIFGSQSFIVGSEQNQSLPKLEMKPMLRPLEVNLTLSETTVDLISSISVTITGIANSWDCILDEVLGDPAKISLDLEQTAEQFHALAYILGTNGEEQSLTITLNLKNGLTQTISENANTMLADFNADKSSIFALNINLGADLSGEIIDRETEQGGSLTVN